MGNAAPRFCVQGTVRKQIYQAWTSLHGPASAASGAKRLPPRPLRGRWGSVSSTESHLLRAGQHELTSSFHAACSSPACKARQRKRNAEAAPVLLDDGDDENSYSAKIGRWAREADEVLHDVQWWHMMRVASLTRGPSDHLYAWLLEAASIRRAGRTDLLPPVVQLVCGKAESIFHEWELLLNRGDHAFHFLHQIQDDDMRLRTTANAVLLCLSGAADFSDRYSSDAASIHCFCFGLYGRPRI